MSGHHVYNQNGQGAQLVGRCLVGAKESLSQLVGLVGA